MCGFLRRGVSPICNSVFLSSGLTGNTYLHSETKYTFQDFCMARFLKEFLGRAVDWKITG